MDLHHHENLYSETENYIYDFKLLIVTKFIHSFIYFHSFGSKKHNCILNMENVSEKVIKLEQFIFAPCHVTRSIGSVNYLAFVQLLKQLTKCA
jgi:hypothetical protein